jgi:cytochrome c2
MKDKKKYLTVLILSGFMLTAVILWLMRSQTDQQVSQSDRNQTHQTPAESDNRGLIIRFHQVQSPDNDSRLSRLLALYISHDEPPTPFLEPGPFQATWEGWIDIDEEDTYTFHFEGTGELEMTVGNERILQAGHSESDPVPLAEGKHYIRAKYASPDTGSSRVRLLWSSSSFGPESIPPMALSHDESDEDLQLASQLRRGRLLIAEHSCLSCHKPDDPSYADESHAMPELARDAPDLTDAGSRLQPGWMKKWIKDPQAVHPSARMPGMNLNDQQAADIAAFLATLGEPPPSHQPPAPSGIKKGGELFALHGCIACHTLDPDIADRERLSLANIAEK